MICDCKCHQNANEKSNCGNCGNTGIKLENKTVLDEIPMIPLEEKPIFTKGTKTLINTKTISEIEKTS